MCVCVCQILSLAPSLPHILFTKMIKEQVASVGISENNANSFPIGVSVLVVDCDYTCLRIVSKMLQTFGYKGTHWMPVNFFLCSLLSETSSETFAVHVQLR